MKEIPILFSTDMVKALLDGRKSQTRRICHDNGDTLIGYEYIINGPTWPQYWKGKYSEPYTGWVAKFNNLPVAMPRRCRYGKPGDLLWVRESWCKPQIFDGYEKDYYYRADGEIQRNAEGRWRPSIHMPKEACRIWLEVKDIRAEQLQDITEADAIAEGCINIFNEANEDGFWTAKTDYMRLWDRINGEESWQSNPWVWVIKFKVLSTTGRPTQLSSNIMTTKVKKIV